MIIPNTTLICIDGSNNDESLRAINYSSKQCRFDTAPVFINDPRIDSIYKYNDIVLLHLDTYFDTSHALIVQNDGFILNPRAWDDAWLEYDYIGAPWALSPAHELVGFPGVTSKNCVGNGGFSLRSKRLYKAIKDIYSSRGVPIRFPEDAVIGRLLRYSLEKDYGIKFAPMEVAAKFSVENSIWCGQFGFHGKLTMKISNISL